VRFSDPAYDAALEETMQEFDPAVLESELKDLTAMVFAEQPIVPLYWQKVHWGLKDGLTIRAGLSEETLPQDVSSEN